VSSVDCQRVSDEMQLLDVEETDICDVRDMVS